MEHETKQKMNNKNDNNLSKFTVLKINLSKVRINSSRVRFSLGKVGRVLCQF